MFDSMLNALPVWLVFFLFALVPAAVAAALHEVFRRIVPAEKLKPHHEVAGFLLSIVGILFAVVLAFVVAAAWGSYDAAQRTADAEAAGVAEAFVTATVLPEPTRSRLRTLMANYAFEVRDHEWSMLANRTPDSNAQQYLLDAFETVARIPTPPNESVQNALHLQTVQQVALQSLHDLNAARRQRLLDVERHIPTDLYVALILGWIIVLAFDFLFGGPRVLQLTMTALLTAMIGLLFALVVEFDLPYGRGIQVSPEAWTSVIDHNHMATYRSQALPSAP
jgi:Protein of unknown function (DUF4239)